MKRLYLCNQIDHIVNCEISLLIVNELVRGDFLSLNILTITQETPSKLRNNQSNYNYYSSNKFFINYIFNLNY
jgi:hypothetical protein